MFRDGNWLLIFCCEPVVIAANPPAEAAARRFIIGASPSLAKEEREAAWAATLEFIVQGMKPGDALAVYDALACSRSRPWKFPTIRSSKNQIRV